MKKSQVNVFDKGTPDYVIAHAVRQQKRGRRPSMAFLGERNPEKALALAKRFKGCNMVVSQDGEKQWKVTFNGAIAAQIHMDYQNQADKVVLMNDDKRCQRFVKELVLSHAVQFVMQRGPMPAALLRVVPERALEEYTCENLISFGKIPSSIFAMSDKTLGSYLSQFVTVVEGKYSSPEQMLTCLLMEIYEKKGILLGIRDAQWSRMDDGHIVATFEIKSEQTFKVWNGNDASNMFHFVAPYHPSRNGKKSVCLINGSTDYYIRGSEAGIRRVLSPEESRPVKEGLFLSSTWSKINHPFYAEGKTLGIEFSAVLCMSKTGYQTLYELLLAAMNQDNLFVAVSGGFGSPYDYAQNVLSRKGIRSPAGKQGAHEVRGSEEDCVWEHEVLKSEGVLDKSVAPDWFYHEGWLKIFEGEEKKFN